MTKDQALFVALLLSAASEDEANARLSSVKRNGLIWRMPMGVAFIGYKDGEYIVKRP